MTYPRYTFTNATVTFTPATLLDCCQQPDHVRHGKGYKCATCERWWPERIYWMLVEQEDERRVREGAPRDRWTPPTWLVLATAATGLLICGLLWWAIWLTVQ